MKFYDLVRLVGIDKPTAKVTIEKNPEFLEMRNGPGESPLHFFVVENHLESVKFLRDIGANVNTVDHFRSTPLMHAVSLGYGDMVEFLISAGADIEAKTINGDTALSYAVMKNYQGMARRILGLCKKEITHYFSDLDASEIVRNPNSDIRRLMIDFGIGDPYGDSVSE
jgi:hypothetical protein